MNISNKLGPNSRTDEYLKQGMNTFIKEATEEDLEKLGNMDTKMVIVVRNDLNMRKGKIGAMCAHASMAFLTKNLKVDYIIDDDDGESPWTFKEYYFSTSTFSNIDEIDHWLKNSFKKIVCYVNSEEELEAIHQKALDAGLMSHLIEDNGLTEFNGVKTKTAVGIGPAFSHKFKDITDHLPLL